MIQLRDLTLARGAKTLIERANLQIHSGQRIGLVGANGCGKSSLLALLTGELQPERGALHVPAHWSISHVSQETSAAERPAVEFVLEGDRELGVVEREIDAAETARDGERLAHAHARFEEIGGYSARSRAESLLAGLGFASSELTRPVMHFSGGWRVRLNLARALMCRSDLLLLDEPTNHLDLDAIVWLEGWLRSFQGTLVVVSHDREFLDNVVTAIANIENRTLSFYRGDYTAFEERRASELALKQTMYERQQREIAHLERFIERFRAKATKAKQAQSRIKALARMERITPAHVDSPLAFCFGAPAVQPETLVTLEAAAAGYGEEPVLSGITLAIRAEERIGLLGRNGAGKSTLVKLLAGLLPPLLGSRRQGTGLKIGYFAQHQLEQLRGDETPLQHLARLDPTAREQDLRDFLGGFGFQGDAALSQVAPFSGGEKSRLALALLVWQRPNLLLLDEPTNHLDLEMRHALTLALQEFDGAVVLVSHDRHLLRTTVDRLVLVANGRVEPFDGDLEDYSDWLLRQRMAPQTQPGRRSGTSKREEKRLEAQARARLSTLRRPLEEQIHELEQTITQLTVEKQRLETLLADPLTYIAGSNTDVAYALKRQAEIARSLDDAEANWLAFYEELQKLG